jgi:hypothetical protein
MDVGGGARAVEPRGSAAGRVGCLRCSGSSIRRLDPLRERRRILDRGLICEPHDQFFDPWPWALCTVTLVCVSLTFSGRSPVVRTVTSSLGARTSGSWWERRTRSAQAPVGRHPGVLTVLYRRCKPDGRRRLANLLDPRAERGRSSHRLEVEYLLDRPLQRRPLNSWGIVWTLASAAFVHVRGDPAYFDALGVTGRSSEARCSRSRITFTANRPHAVLGSMHRGSGTACGRSRPAWRRPSRSPRACARVVLGTCSRSSDNTRSVGMSAGAPAITLPAGRDLRADRQRPGALRSMGWAAPSRTGRR